MARILVADDDPFLRSTLRIALSGDGHQLIEAEDSDQALELFPTENPDLIVLDVSMPGIDGFTVCKRIRADSSVPILMLTGRDDVQDRVMGLQNGADDYLGKPFAVEELCARVKTLLRRTPGVAPLETGTLTFGDVELDTESHEASRAGEPLALTPHEFLLLQFLMQHPRQVLSREQICREVWGFPFGGESNFIDVTVKDLRRKLEANGGPRVVDTVRGFGYALREPQEGWR
jgi:two-component system, OmpR family, response regulator MprA